MIRLMVYPMTLSNETIQDMDKAMYYCSMDMANGFWVVEMTEMSKKYFSIHYDVRLV